MHSCSSVRMTLSEAPYRLLKFLYLVLFQLLFAANLSSITLESRDDDGGTLVVSSIQSCLLIRKERSRSLVCYCSLELVRDVLVF